MYEQLTSIKIMNINSRTRNLLPFLLVTILWLAAVASAQTPSGKQGQAVAPQAGSTPVTGSGMAGRLSKWTGVAGVNTFTLGDSIIFEDKFGKVGIGTLTPTSILTVQGMIETTLGGYKFPDGTVQTTAANGLQSVFHDATLKGNGTSGSPLGINLPLTLSGSTVFQQGGNNYLVKIENLGDLFAGGLIVTGGGGGNGVFSGNALKATGGVNTGTGIGGTGAELTGGFNTSTGGGGFGAMIEGGSTENGNGGVGALIRGGAGASSAGFGGVGLHVLSGFMVNGGPKPNSAVFEGDVDIFGDLNVIGNLSKSAGSFKIDHPLDPENKYLYHSFVESPDMMNIYNGNVITDANGEASIALPEYFGALNRDFRYQLTVIGTFAQAIIAEEVKDNHFRIKTSAADVKVSWQVTGIRQDAFANQHRIPVEVEKSEKERGYYLMPELYNQPEERDIRWARNPQMMREIKQQRTEPGQGKQQKPINH